MMLQLHCLWLSVVFISYVSGSQSTPQGKPRILQPPKDTMVQEYDHVEFSCQVEGDPTPHIMWLMDKQPYDTERFQNFRNGTLSITNVNRKDEGSIICQAENTGGVVYATARLTVLYGPEICISQFQYGVEAGQNVSLECEVTGKPLPSLRWHKGNNYTFNPPVEYHTSPVTNGIVGIMTIAFAEKSDSGVYVCKASSAMGTQSAETSLYIKEKPSIVQPPVDTVVQENHKAEFSCRAESKPTSSIIWMKDGQPLEQGRFQTFTNGTLRIKSVKWSDEGIYTCQAENSVGVANASAELTVYYGPIIYVSQHPSVVVAGENVSLGCDVAGKPKPTIRWFKVHNDTSKSPVEFYHLNFTGWLSGITTEMSIGIMTIMSTQKSDSGVYVCEARSDLGSAFKEAFLLINEKPNIVHPPVDTAVVEYREAEFSCQATGVPNPSIIWRKGNQPLEPERFQAFNNTLRIMRVRQRDAGNYTCRAENNVGFAEATATLAVYYPVLPFKSVELQYQIGFVTVMIFGRREVLDNLPVNNFGKLNNYWKYTTPAANRMGDYYMRIESNVRSNMVNYESFRAELSDLMRSGGWTLHASYNNVDKVHDIWEKYNGEA